MTLALKPDLAMVKMHLDTKNEISGYSSSKLWPKQTHRHTRLKLLPV